MNTNQQLNNGIKRYKIFYSFANYYLGGMIFRSQPAFFMNIIIFSKIVFRIIDLENLKNTLLNYSPVIYGGE